MLLRVLADTVVIAHFGFILFVLLGGVLALRWRRIAWVHLPAATWGVAIEVFGWFCPLTDIENFLRRASGEAGYPGSFIERYLLPVVYPTELTREVQIALASVVLLVNAGVYILFWRKGKSRGV